MPISSTRPSRPFRGIFFDEFITLDLGIWAKTLGGAASIGPVLGGDPNHAGLGIIEFQASEAPDDGTLQLLDGDVFDGRLTFRLATRVRVNANPADFTFSIGVADGQGAQNRVLVTAGNGGGGSLNWILDCASTTGGQGATDDSGIQVDTNWHDMVLEVVPGVRATLFLDGAQIAEVTTAAALPTSGDGLSATMRGLFVGGNGGEAFVDYYELRIGE